MFLLSREKPFGEKLAAPHKKHFAQEATNNGEETEACDCEAVPDSLCFIGISLRSSCSIFL